MWAFRLFSLEREGELFFGIHTKPPQIFLLFICFQKFFHERIQFFYKSCHFCGIIIMRMSENIHLRGKRI